MIVDYEKRLIRINLEIIIKWLRKLDSLNEKDYSIYALNFCLYKMDYSNDGFTAYELSMTGSEKFSAENDDWASYEDFIPSSHYVSPTMFAPDDFEEGYALAYFRTLIFHAIERLRHLYLFDVNYITIGYQTGELYQIRNVGHLAMNYIKNSLLDIGF